MAVPTGWPGAVLGKWHPWGVGYTRAGVIPAGKAGRDEAESRAVGWSPSLLRPGLFPGGHSVVIYLFLLPLLPLGLLLLLCLGC